MRELANLERRVLELERRLANTIREGVVDQVSEDGRRVRLRLGGQGGEAFLSPWVRHSQIAGALKVHTPPSPGQQMTLCSPGGDFRRGQALPFTWSDAEPAPYSGTDRNVLTFGDLRIEVRADALVVTLGDSELHIEAGQILLKAGEIRTDGVTRLDGGERPVVFAGSTDSRGDVNGQGAARVLV